MKPGQVLRKAWQDYVLGRGRKPLAQEVECETGYSCRASDRFFDIPDDPAEFVAPERLKAPAFFYTDALFRQWERADWQRVDRRVMRWSALLIEMARRRQVPLYVHSAFRTEAEQAEMVKRGVSKAPYPRSAHNIGAAVDIIHGVYHWQMSKQEWAFISVLGRLALDRINAQLPKARKLALNWGGDDGPRDRFAWDPAHWEIAGYRDWLKIPDAEARIRALPVGEPQRYTPRRILKEVKL